MNSKNNNFRLYEDVHGKIKNERKKKKVDKDKKKEPTKK